MSPFPASVKGATATANVGYVRDNDAPVNTLPADQVMLEDATLNIKGIFISDIDASAGDLTVTRRSGMAPCS